MNIEKIILNQTKPFTLEDIKKKIADIDEKSHRLLEDLLEESPYLFVSDKKDRKDKSTYTPRCSIFNGTKFIIKPSELEIQKGILFSGHRFIPFYPDDIYPTESFTIKTDSGEAIRAKTIKFKLEDLYPYYSLFGAENIIDDLVADHPENRKIIGNSSEKITISVFNFSKFYATKEFLKSKSLIFSLENWNKGIFSVSINCSKQSSDNRKKWFNIFEDCLQKVFDKKGPHFEIPEQLAHAYFYSEPFALNSPPCPIDEFIRQSARIQIKFHEDNTILWHSDVKESIAQKQGNVSISLGTIESLDAILEELKLNITSINIEKLMRDAIADGTNNISPIIHKIFPKSGLTFKDKAQEAAFYNHIEELWEETVNNPSS